MKYYRYGHVDKIKVKVGDKIWKGQLIAQNGTGNGQWYAHCHFDILTYKPIRWTNYVIGQSKAWVEARYADPRGLAKLVMPTYDHLGYGWLWDADYAGKHAFHSGLDLNGEGSGNADLDDPIHSACDGVVEYVYNGSGSNAGWGQIIIIREETMPKTYHVKSCLINAIEDLTGDDYKKEMSEKEQVRASEDLKDFKEKLELQIENLTEAGKQMGNSYKELIEQNAKITKENSQLKKDKDDLIRAGTIMEDTIDKFEREQGKTLTSFTVLGYPIIIKEKIK